MPTTPSGIYWESQGPVAAPAVLLIEGYTGQLIGWRDAFCDLLLAQGLRVLRMDNRDVGLSRREDGNYMIADMADDVVDVIADADLGKITIVGQSMGGLIAQHTALGYPNMVTGLVLFYTTPVLDDIDPGILTAEIPRPQHREDAIASFLEGDRATASPAWGYDEAWKRELAGRMFDRAPDRSGLSRQRNAVALLPDLRPRLTELTMPVALIHGRDDALIRARGSLRIAEVVPQAELHLYPGMGHEIAPALWDEFVAIITRIAVC
ncbi:hydrolase (plasmid) [Arthrobacter sp. NicSoilE8]|nr:hydrolase [Arthrobacter sp. NicSoilE8]